MQSTQDIKTYIDQAYDYIGETRQREMVRLLYEIAKREKKAFIDVAREMPQPPQRFDRIKSYLVERRFPQAIARGEKVHQSFAEVDVDEANRYDLTKPLVVEPKRFYIEKAVEQSALAKRIFEKYNDRPIEIIDSYRDFHKKPYQTSDYNQRTENFFVIKEEYDFYKSCPCSTGSVHCAYHVVNLGSGCAFECTYCYLQDYLKKPGIIVPGNLEDFFEKFKGYDQNVRIGSGEATDSLIFDHITGYSARIVDFFRNYPNAQFEFKTKSNNIAGLLETEGANNVIISWSVNPPNIIKSMEYYTASLDQRLTAAQTCVDHGYSVAFHFDPMIFHEGWQDNYCFVVDQIFERIPEQKIAWISLGTLRMLPALKKVIENRFPKNPILDGELMTDYDGKLRYSARTRADIYRHMTDIVKKRSSSVPFYLCMEEKSMCQNVGTGMNVV